MYFIKHVNKRVYFSSYEVLLWINQRAKEFLINRCYLEGNEE